MLSWSAKRQLLYGSGVLLVLLIIFGTPSYFLFFRTTATCFDQKQNQGETGVDCGGPCQLACQNEVIPLPVTIWARAFPVADGIYNLTAYLQNGNIAFTSNPAKYLFRVYDSDNVLIGIREGITSVPPTKNFPIFEQGFNAGHRVPAKVFFEFTSDVTWNKFTGTLPDFAVQDQNFIGTTTASSSLPTLQAKLINNTVYAYKNVEVVAIIYDDNGNAMATSRTIVDTLGGKQTIPLTFTWPQYFLSNVSKIEIIPKVGF